MYPTSFHNGLADPVALLRRVRELRAEVDDEARKTFDGWPTITRRAFLPSARNLARYLALRARDLRPLQTALIPWGLSSLGRSESRVMPSLDAVIATLADVAGEPREARMHARPPRARISAASDDSP